MPEETVNTQVAPIESTENRSENSSDAPSEAPKPKRRAAAKKPPSEAARPRARRKGAADENVQAPLPIDAPPAVLSSFSSQPANASDTATPPVTPVIARSFETPREESLRSESSGFETPQVVAPREDTPRREAEREIAPQNEQAPQSAMPSDNGAASGNYAIENANASNRESSNRELSNGASARETTNNEGVSGETQAGEHNGANGQNDGRLRFRGRDGRALRPARTFGREGSERPESRPFEARDNRQEPRDNRPRENRPNENRGENRQNENRNNENRNNENRNDNREPNGFNGPRNDNRNDNREPRNDRDNRRGRDGRDNRDGRNNDNRNNENRNEPREYQPKKPDYDLAALETKTLQELRDIATELNADAPETLKNAELAYKILDAQAEAAGNLIKRGILEIQSDGKGFLRCSGYLSAEGDVYVSQSQVKRFNLRTGDMVMGLVRAPKEMERFHGLLRVEAINGESPEAMRSRKEFEKLTPIFPTEKFKLEIDQGNITARIIDMVSPLGKGQRGLIVAPPKAGKTTLLKNIANSIALNHPEVLLIVLLIDERPEEVTDISRSVKGEVVASTFDEMPENHMRVAELVFEKAKRLVEQGQDVVILLDSITRLSRASNLVVTPSGRTLSGGLDPAAMYRPKRMFGAARNIEEGGSLTILATTLVDTGSRMDEMIFEEFKGTGNLDLVLDRDLFNQRVFPAIDINKSGTRRDDLLLSKDDLAATFHLRRTLAQLDNDKAIHLLIDRLKNTRTNADFMTVVQKSMRQSQSGAINGG